MVVGVRLVHGRLLILGWVLILVALPAVVTATEYIVTGDWRLIDDFFEPLPPGAVEAALPVTITADRPINLIPMNPAFVRQDPFSFTTWFPWNWPEPRVVLFQDDLSDTNTVVVTPRPPREFRPQDHALPVVSITTDATGLWDPEVGIYVAGNATNYEQRGSEWERAARFQFYEPEQGLVVDQAVGLRIHGGFSRHYHQKGLRLYFDDYGASDEIDHAFFGAGPSSFRRLICRANRFDSVALNTNLAEGLMVDLGHAGSRYRYLGLYLNQEYWGAYCLRERLDDEFFEHTWRLVRPDDWNFIKDGDEEEGNADGWWEFLSSFAAVTDPTDPVWFDEVRRTLDLASYIDWQLINFYLVPGDNGFSWNLALYQPGDHPWRVVMWDEDLIMDPADLTADMFQFFTADGAAQWDARQAPSDNRPWTPEQQEWLTMFRTLLGSPDFRALFRSRYEHLIRRDLTPEAMVARLAGLHANLLPEVPGQADRWTGFQVDWYQEYVVSARQWLVARHPHFLAQAERFFAQWAAPDWPGDYAGLVINEIMPLNGSTIADESGDHDGWLELYNAGAVPINLTGVRLATDLSSLVPWEMPAVLIRPGEHQLVWFDEQVAAGPLHTPLRLDSRGGVVRLAAPAAAGGYELDRQEYGDAQADRSQGRRQDGAGDWIFQAIPTPGGPNDNPLVPPRPVPSVVELQDNYPNPFNPETNLVYGVPARQQVLIQVFDARGHVIVTLVDEQRDGGFHPVRWDGTDSAGRVVASGVYFARLITDGRSLTKSMTLIR